MKISKLLLGVLVAALAMPAMAAIPTFTGDVEVDFTGSGVLLIEDPDGDVGMPPTPPGTTGWDLDDLRLTYDSVGDTMYIGLNTVAILGDADGDGDPSVTSSYLAGLGGTDVADLGSSETAAVYFDLDQDGNYDVIAGISGVTNYSGFSVNEFTGAFFPPFNFGTTLPSNTGTISANPSSSSPDLEFSILNWSTLPNHDGDLGFNVGAFLGSLEDAGIGEDFLVYSHITSTVVGITAEPIDAGTVDLIVTEQNDGDVPLTDVAVVVDDGTTDIALLDETNVTSGDGGVLGVLEVGETWTWSYTTVSALENITVGTGKTFTATGTGTDPADFEVTYPDDPDEQSSVTVIPQPEIDVEKTVDCEEALDGYPVTYTITIKNTGPVAVTPTLVDDDHLGDLTADFIAECGVLDVGEECTKVYGPITLPTSPNPFVNEVEFKAVDDQAQYAGPVTDTAEVLFLTADFTVEKVCLTDPVPEGEDAEFEITITNTGDVDLVIITDESELPGPTSLVVGQPIVLNVFREVTDGDVYNGINVLAYMPDDTEICYDPEDFPIGKSDNDTCTVAGDTFCSFTQGYWGNAGGTKCGGKTTTELLTAAFASAPGGVIIVGSGGNTITFEKPQDVLDGLPAGSKPRALSGAYTYSTLPGNMKHKKTGAIRNVLVGQVVALQLNLLVSDSCLGDDSGDLGAWVLYRTL